MKFFNGTKLIQVIREANLESILIELAKESDLSIWLVGGLIRDVMQNKCPLFADFDLIVKPGKKSWEVSQKIAKHLGCKSFVLDESRDTYRISGKDFQVDINAIRGEELIDDLFLRDFSLNAICCSCQALSETFLNGYPMIPYEDFFGGMEDLQHKLIRSQNPGSFVDDPLRILRAYRFSALNHWNIEEQTYLQMLADKEKLLLVSMERIRDEVCTILSSPESFPTISSMDRDGVLEIFFPFLPLFDEIDQTYTTKLKVRAHTLATLDYLEQIFKRIQFRDFPFSEMVEALLSKPISGTRSRLVLLKIASLLHDIGKPGTLSEEEDRLRFFNHEILGSEMASKWLESLKFSTQEIDWIIKIISIHMRPHHLSNAEKLTPRAMYRFFREGGDCSVPLLLLALADAYATKMIPTGELTEYENFITTMLTFFSIPEQVRPKPILNGNDVMEILSLPPSRIIGSLLEELLELQSIGQISSKGEAVLYLKNKKL